MRRSIPKINKILVCVLALMLLVRSSVGVYAEDESGSASGEYFSIASTNEEKSEETSEEITGATNEDGEGDVPLGGGDKEGDGTTIPETETPTNGEVKTSQLALNILITIIILLIAIIITVIIYNQKSNPAIHNSGKKDNHKK